MSKKETKKTHIEQLSDEIARILKNTGAITVLIRRDTLENIQEQLHRLADLEK